MNKTESRKKGVRRKKICIFFCLWMLSMHAWIMGWAHRKPLIWGYHALSLSLDCYSLCALTIAARITVFLSHSFCRAVSVALGVYRYVRLTEIHFFSTQLSFAFNYKQTQDYEMCVPKKIAIIQRLCLCTVEIGWLAVNWATNRCIFFPFYVNCIVLYERRVRICTSLCRCKLFRI